MIAVKQAASGLGHADYGIDERFERMVWVDVIANAERHNDPGRFTAFAGYEWTVAGGSGHRNVIFADGPKLTSQVVPFSALDSCDPEDLWAYLHNYEERCPSAGQDGDIHKVTRSVGWRGRNAERGRI